MLPGLLELLLGVFSFVPVDWFGHGVVFLGLGFCLILAYCLSLSYLTIVPVFIILGFVVQL